MDASPPAAVPDGWHADLVDAAAETGVAGPSGRIPAVRGGLDVLCACAICPGAVNGLRIDRVISAEADAKGMTEHAVRQGYADGTALMRLPDAGDVAAVALFPASPAACTVTGQAWPVDGMTCKADA